MKTNNDSDKFVKLVKQMKSLMEEFSVLSKKKPDGAVNKFKIKLINPVLEVANYFVDDKRYKPFEEFELFDEDTLPTNSDVLVILSQYIVCLEKYYEDKKQYYKGDYYWIINKKRSEIIAPRNFMGI